MALAGNAFTYYRADSIGANEGEVNNNEFHYPIVYLISINELGLPLAKLELKIGAPIMIL